MEAQWHKSLPKLAQSHVAGTENPKNLLKNSLHWIHVEQHSMKALSSSFRSNEEAKRCYNRFDRTICVSEFVKKDFTSILDFDRPIQVLYNTVESEQIILKAKEQQCEIVDSENTRLVAVGTLKESKGYMRLLHIINRLVKEKYTIHLYILGRGPLEKQIKKYIADNSLQSNITMRNL